MSTGREWYVEYLKSAHWQETRLRKLEAAQMMCERCGEGGKHRGDRWIGLDVHHLSYERVGREEMDDLEVLCIHCHQVEHRKAPDTEWNRIKIRRRLAVPVLEWFDDSPEFPI